MSSINGQQGDQVALISPSYTYARPTSLSFVYYLQSGEIGGAISLYQYSELHVPVGLLFADSDHVNSLQTATACLPNGTYSLLFLATLGQSFASDVTLDNVAFNGACQLPSQKMGKSAVALYLSRSCILSLHIRESCFLKFVIFYLS